MNFPAFAVPRRSRDHAPAVILKKAVTDASTAESLSPRGLDPSGEDSL
jgi:hypothetical protein